MAKVEQRVIKITRNTNASGKSVRAKQVLTAPDDISHEDAETLVQLKKAVYVAEPSEDDEEKLADVVEAIEAIGALDNKSDFTVDGRVKLDALGLALERDVTAAERDAAYALMGSD